MVEVTRATREKSKLRIALAGVSGGGKTLGALLLASGLTGGDFSKVCLIDTEHRPFLALGRQFLEGEPPHDAEIRAGQSGRQESDSAGIPDQRRGVRPTGRVRNRLRNAGRVGKCQALQERAR